MLKNTAKVVLVALAWFVPLIVYSYDLTADRSYSSTLLHLPQKCQTDEFSELCSRFSRFFVSRFERKVIAARNELLSQQEQQGIDAGYVSPPPAFQEITLTIRPLLGLNIALIDADILQKTEQGEKRILETINLDLKTDRPLRFENLFDDPHLAAMLCARAFDKEFERFHMPLFNVISAAIEDQPRNFTLYPDGIELFFLPGTAKPGDQISKLFVKADYLKAAGVKEHYFPLYSEQQNRLKSRH